LGLYFEDRTTFFYYMLLIFAVVTGLIPTFTRSMPEKDRFAIVEKYGDYAKAVRRFLPGHTPLHTREGSGLAEQFGADLRRKLHHLL